MKMRLKAALALLICLLLLAQAGLAALSEGLTIEGDGFVDAPVPETEVALGGEAGATEAAEDNAAANAAWDGDMYIDGNTLVACHPHTDNVDMVVPKGVTVIGNLAFSQYNSLNDGTCKNIKSVALPATVIRIEDNAFDSCGTKDGLTVELPASVIYIGPWAFNNSGLTSVAIPSSVTAIESSTFANCVDLASVTLPGSITKIDNEAFKSCTALTAISLPAGITLIGERAFAGCSALTAIALPESVLEIKEGTFQACTLLSSVALPSGLNKLGASAFARCYVLPSISIPQGVTAIGASAFQDCSSLTSAKLSDSTQTIDNYAFYNCGHLTSVNAEGVVALPDSVKKIGRSAFANCLAVTDLVIGSNITSIGADAFDGCVQLKNITIKGKGNIEGVGAFDNIHPAATFNVSCALALSSHLREKGYTVNATHGAVATDPAVAPTCTQNGLTEGSHCADCGAIYVAQQVVPATGHTPVTDPAVAPTFTETGLTEGSHCAVCGAVLVAQEEVPTLTGTVKLSGSSTVELAIGKSKTIRATVTPSAYAGYLTWKSSKPSVATVSAKGVVKALKKGTAEITAKLPDGSSDSVTITVVAPKPTKVAITKGKTAKLKVGKKLTLKAKLTPSNAESKLTWKTSDKKVATVTSKGVVTAKKAGKAKITVTTANGKKATITIQVVEK